MNQKKMMISLLLIVAMLLSLVACSSEKAPKAKDISGYYVLESATIDGEEMDVELLAWGEYELFVQLNEDNTAVFFNGMELIDCTYRNGQLKPIEGESMVYRVEDRELTLIIADGEMVFKRTSQDVPDLEELAQALAIPPEVGYFKFDYATDGDVTYTAEDFAVPVDMFVLLYEDGTGYFCDGSELMEMRWADGEIYEVEEPDEIVNYTVDSESLKFEQDGLEMAFERSDDTPPDLEVLREELDPEVPGYYLMTKLVMGDEEMDLTILEDYYEVMPFLLLNEDGSGVLYDGSDLTDVSWDEDFLVAMGDPTEYTLIGDELTIAQDDIKMVFERSDDTPPDIDALRGTSVSPVGEYVIYAYDMGSGMEYTDIATLSIYADGTGLYVIEDGESESEVVWDEEYISVGGIEYTYEVDTDGWLYLDGADGYFVFEPKDGSGGGTGSDESLWNNDWYGWWIMTDCTGDLVDFEGMWWDMCAKSELVNGEGYMMLWDEDYNSIYDLIGEMYFVADDESFTSNEGYFYLDEFTDELSCDLAYSPAADMLILSGDYSDSTCSYHYEIYLRPWGVYWDDVEEYYLPYYYYDWYLPLIEAGEPMPDTLEP